MPVPRKFDRRPPERDLTRINDRIRVPEVRLVGEDGKQIGVIKTSEALAYAQQRDLDLVEVAPEARPPVCRVLDYSKYKYEQAQKQKAARRHQQQITIREIKFRPKIAQNDYDTKKGHITRFLLGKDKVKVTIMFRGREVTHPERGTALLDRLAGRAVRACGRRAVADPGRAQHDDDAGAVQGGAGGREGPARRRTDDHAETRGKGSRRDRARAEAEAQADGSNGSRRNGSGSEPSDDAEADEPSRAGLADRGFRRSRRLTPPPDGEIARGRAACRLPSALLGASGMPKMKTHSGAKKRFRLTANGKVRGRHAFTSHILEKKSPKRKRAMGRPVAISKHDEPRVKTLLGAKHK